MARGDHLYYFRAGNLYSHHGICCGDGTVIHYESSIWMKLAVGREGTLDPQIKRVSIEEFAQGSELLTRAYDACDPSEVAVERALSRIGEVEYSLFNNNCEHFAVWCKTGWPVSTQVDAHRDARNAVVRGAPLGAQLLRAASRVATPYRGWAYAAAFAAAGGVYAGTYLVRRQRNRDDGVS